MYKPGVVVMVLASIATLCAVVIGFDTPLTSAPLLHGTAHHRIPTGHLTPALWSNATASLRSLMTPSTAGRSKQIVLQEIAEENTWKNDLVLPWVLPEAVRASLPRFFQAWLRNYLLSFLVYFGVAGLWAYYIYYSFGDQLFVDGGMPTGQAMLEQIKVCVWGGWGAGTMSRNDACCLLAQGAVILVVCCILPSLSHNHNIPQPAHSINPQVSVKALPMYSALPAFNEMIAEHGWTRAYARLSDVGLGTYVGYMALYMLLVEFGVYWMHRSLHEIPWAYKHIHATHHKYNKENTLSPFAGLAFHPLDGVLQVCCERDSGGRTAHPVSMVLCLRILLQSVFQPCKVQSCSHQVYTSTHRHHRPQAIPYTIVMLFVPVHFLTHELLLFFTGVWTTNIHDCLHANVPPIMGAGFHTIHHTTYRHNYGQFFTLMDGLHGTLVHPEEYAAEIKQGAAKEQ